MTIKTTDPRDESKKKFTVEWLDDCARSEPCRCIRGAHALLRIHTRSYAFIRTHTCHSHVPLPAAPTVFSIIFSVIFTSSLRYSLKVIMIPRGDLGAWEWHV